MCLQKHLPGELTEAATRVDYSLGHCVFHNHRDVLTVKGGPPTLYVGASHVNHLKSFLQQHQLSENASIAFSRSYFAGVGGTTWSLIEPHLKGQGLNQNQAYLGDQWSELIKTGFTPKYIVLVCGSNDTDKFQNSIEQNARSWPKSMHWKYANKKLNAAYERITKKIDSVLLFLHTAFPEAKFLYSKILPRCWWGHHARMLARWLDHYVVCRLKRTYKVKEIWARDVFKQPFHLTECVEFGMLKTDMVHLNENGNRALISAIMKPLLHQWKFAPLEKSN